MKRGLLILILFFSSVLGAQSRTGLPRYTFGAEWSYTATFFTGHRYYFIAPEGFRVDDRNDEFKYFTDAEIFAHAGMNINSKWNLSLYLGYIGIGDFHAGIPLSVRATRFFGDDHLRDRWFAYCDIGSGLSMKEHPQALFTAKAGGGYRLSFSRLTKLDFIASIRFIHTHPDIIFYGEKIRMEQINRNIGYTLSTSFGLSITF